MRTFNIGKAFRGITPLTWADVPRFAILAGHNGVGKSQLLELLAYGSSAGVSPLELYLDTPQVLIEPAAESSGYLPAAWSAEDVTIDHVFFSKAKDFARTVEEALKRPPESSPGWLRDVAADVRPAKAAGGSPLSEVLRATGMYGLVTREPSKPLSALAQMFHSYVSARVTLALDGVPAERHAALLGRPPWEAASDLLREFGLNYELTQPDDIRLPFELRCVRPGTGVSVPPSKLSSGEQATLALVALVVTTEAFAASRLAPIQQPAILYLDEPDAHLHTSLIKGYLDNLQRIVARGVQVVMTTHRPDTLALAPADSLWEMRRHTAGASVIAKVASKSELIARLAADTIAVLPSVRVVLVEDEDDRAFHQAAYDLVLALPDGLLPLNPRLAFMPVMSKPDKDGKLASGATGDGGWTAVVKRMNELRNQGMQAVFRGLVDGDDRKATLPADVLRLDRYSIESYWADPLGLYQWAVHSDTAMGKEIAASGGIPLTDLNDLRSFDAARLQPAADAIIQRVEASLPADQPRDRRDVTLLSAKGAVVLRYPEWLWTTPKRLLTDAVTTALTGGVHNAWKKALRAVGFIPADLIDVHRRLITERL